MASLYETAARLHDPRVKGRSKHLLADIVILAVLAVTSGAEGYEAIEEFGKYHYQTLRKRLRLPWYAVGLSDNGIPSHDTINRVFQAIKFRQFERLFLEWTEGLKPEGSAEHVIAIDGKTVRGSRDGYHDNHLMRLPWRGTKKNLPCQKKVLLLQRCISNTMQKVSTYNSLTITHTPPRINNDRRND